jgi:peptidoglycan/LPS O-acetylase OafA/YrhL
MAVSENGVPRSIAGVPTRAPTEGSARNYHLDAIRGCAAMVVVFYHTVMSYIEPYQKGTHGLLPNVLHTVHYWAGAAVLLFFVLSGYLVGTSVLRAHERKTWAWANYLLSRLSRLYTVLIPALVACVIFDFFGHHLARTIPIYTGINPTNGQPYVWPDTWASFIGTSLFVQNILTGVYGSIGPAWSLANEFWYYILFPIMVGIFVKNWRGLASLVVCVAIALFVGVKIVSLFPAWLGGIAVGRLAEKYPLRSKWVRRSVFIASILGVGASIAGAAAHKLGVGIATDYPIALSGMGIVYAALCMPPAGGLYAKVAIFLSEISYTLYLTHQPLIIFLGAAWLGTHKWSPTIGHLPLMLIPIGAALIYACGMYYLFESRTDSVRGYFKRRLPARLFRPNRIPRPAEA